MKILIIGYGFIGSRLAQVLREKDHEINLISRKAISLKGVNSYVADISNRELMVSLVAKIAPDYIFHLASSRNRDRSISAIRHGIDGELLGTLNILEAASQVSHLLGVVMIGSAEEYGGCTEGPAVESQREQPIGGYSLTKTCQAYLGQVMHQYFHLPIITIRPTIVYGPEQSTDMFIPALILGLIKNNYFKMTAGEQWRDFIYIDDLVDALIRLLDAPKAVGEIINIGSGQSVQIKFLAEKIADRLGKRSALHLGELAYRENEIFEYHVSIQKAEKLLAWKPTVSINMGIEKTVDYFKGLL